MVGGSVHSVSNVHGWEYGIADKAYIGCPELITEYKLPPKRRGQPPPPPLTPHQLQFNHTIQHYRARVEHLIGEMVRTRRTLSTRWRGSFSLLACIMKIVAHMVGLQERMNGPRYDVFGPWPHAPAHIVAAYP